mmetsp:Transcript_34810/g.70410  ORF Transcript_34810/g.70410 Transcript_34810/m.70410 type:complete len:567 (+) Transcript_34810:317-2017(+)
MIKCLLTFDPSFLKCHPIQNSDEDEQMGGDGGSDEKEFDYTDDDQSNHDEGEVALENAYYNAKGLRETDLTGAEEAFLGVITLEQGELAKESGGEDTHGTKFGPWSYKSIKQLIKLHLASNNTSKAMEQYNQLLLCVAGGVVSPNAIEKGVNSMLERVSASLNQSSSASGAADDASKELASNIYEKTAQMFHPQTGQCPNERLWFKTLLKFGQLLYEMNEAAKLQLVIRDLLRGSGQQDGAGGGDTSAATASGSTNLMEIYALQIQLYSRQKDNKKLREIFDKAMRVQGGIPHPRTLALIQELGGKMHMQNREFDAAGKTFFQAFKSYDEAGDSARLRCLKYLVLSSMLHASSINPFDSQEARPYRDDPEIVSMTNLVQAFHNNEIKKFEGILRRNEGKIMDDEFVREHLADLLRTIRTQVLLKVLGPYECISLKAIARELNGIPTQDVESLLVALILDGRLKGRIDQVAGVLHKSPEKGVPTASVSSSAAGGGASAPSASGSTSATESGGASASGSSSDVVGGSTSSIEMRNYEAVDTLASALENLTAAVTSVSGMGKSSSLRVM